MRWISKLADIPSGVWCGEPVAWLFDSADIGSYPQLRPAAEDMCDSAHVGIDRGGRRLVRLGGLRLLAAHATGVHPDEIHIERREDRGLRIVAPKTIYVSDAGSGAWSAVAISGGPIGVDIEERPADGPLPLDLLHAEEREFLNALDPDLRNDTFLRFWTAREAYLKETEQGLANALGAICACARDEGIVELKRCGLRLGFAQTLMRRNCVAALAAQD